MGFVVLVWGLCVCVCFSFVIFGVVDCCGF